MILLPSSHHCLLCNIKCLTHAVPQSKISLYSEISCWEGVLLFLEIKDSIDRHGFSTSENKLNFFLYQNIRITLWELISNLLNINLIVLNAKPIIDFITFLLYTVYGISVYCKVQSNGTHVWPYNGVKHIFYSSLQKNVKSNGSQKVLKIYIFYIWNK